MRKLGLDLGTKTCGFAISDELCIISNGLENFHYDNNNFELILNRINYYYEYYQNKIDEIVLGFPTNAYDGSLNERSHLVLDFKKYLEDNLIHQIKITLYDERFTTRITKSYLKDSYNMKNSYIKKIKDKMSSHIILEEYNHHYS